MNKNLFIIISIFLLFVTVSLYAGGENDPEANLDRAEMLINEKKYDEARIILADVIKKNPDQFEAAQKLLTQILNVQNQFNDRYEELIRVLYDEKNVEKALELIEELKVLDPNPNDAVVYAIEKARRGAVVIANLNRFNKIMDTALAQIKRKEYYKAIETYLTGFDLHKDEFDLEDYGEIVKNAVDKSQSELLILSEIFIGKQEEINKREANLIIKIEELNTDIDEKEKDEAVLSEEEIIEAIKEELLEFLDFMIDIESIKTDISKIAELYNNQNKIIQENNENNAGDYFLYYAESIIVGRKIIDEREGLVEAIALLMEEKFNSAESLLKSKAESHLNMVYAFYNKGDYISSEPDINKAVIYYLLLMQLKYQLEKGEQLEKNYNALDFASVIMEPELLGFMKYQLKLKECYGIEYMNNRGFKNTDFRSAIGPVKINELINIREGVEAITEELDSYAVNWDSFYSELDNNV